MLDENIAQNLGYSKTARKTVAELGPQIPTSKKNPKLNFN